MHDSVSMQVLKAIEAHTKWVNCMLCGLYLNKAVNIENVCFGEARNGKWKWGSCFSKSCVMV